MFAPPFLVIQQLPHQGGINIQKNLLRESLLSEALFGALLRMVRRENVLLLVNTTLANACQLGHGHFASRCIPRCSPRSSWHVEVVTTAVVVISLSGGLLLAACCIVAVLRLVYRSSFLIGKLLHGPSHFKKIIFCKWLRRSETSLSS